MKARIAILIYTALTLSAFAQEKPADPAKPAAQAAKPTEPAKPADTAPKSGAFAKATAGGDSTHWTGFFFEGYGLFTLSIAAQTGGLGNSTKALPDGTVSSTSTTYAPPNTMGFGGGGALGYFFHPNLAVLLSFDYRYLKSRKWSQSSTSGSSDTQNKFATSWIGLGLRPRIAVGPGAVYAGAGVAFLLPHNDLQVTTPASGSTTTIETEYNYTFGAYGEIGYQFEITEGIYLGLGSRLFIAGPSNKDGVSESGTTQLENTATVSSSSAIPQAPYGTKNITDVSFTLILGLRL